MDFVLAVSFLVIFLQSFVAFSDGMIAGQDYVSVSAQQRSIANQIEQTIMSGNSVSGHLFARIDFGVPDINSPSGRSIENCTVTLSELGGGKTRILILTELAELGDISHEKVVVASKLTFPTTAIRCGDTISFTS